MNHTVMLARNLIVLLTLLMCTACSVDKGTTEATPLLTDAEETIAKNLIQGSFDDLWAGLDSTKILDYHTEDFYILEQGEVWTNQEIKNYMRGALQRENRARRENRMDYLNIEKHGTAINIAYNNYATFYQGDSIVGRAQWLESALAIPTEAGWRLRMMHSTGVNR